MGKLTELEQWDEDVYQIETSDPVLGGPEGITNKPQKQLANRTQWLKKRLEEANDALAEHEKSRNHPDATLTDKGFVKLYSGVTSVDETMAATPKAVKIAMDNANERLAKARNLADLPSVPLALQNLTLAATKKAVEDTQTGLSAQPVMWISSADDLSNLPAGARRFAKNNAGVTVLPSADYCYIEVLAKRDTANGSCIKVVEYSNPGNAWTGTRNNVPADAAFTWVRQYNESYRPPQQAMPDMPDALIRGNNLSDLTDPAAGVRNLGLTETVKLAAGAMQKNQNGADIPDKPLFVRTLGIVDAYPAGCPIPYPGPTAPEGYLLMDGRAFSKTLYPQLAKLYADGYLPDLRGMYVRGWDSAGRVDVAGYDGGMNHLGNIFNYKATLYLRDLVPLGAVSPRGYDLYIRSQGSYKVLFENKRSLLSNQYYEYLMDDLTGSLKQLYEYRNPNGNIISRYEEPYYELEESEEASTSLSEVIRHTKIKLLRKQCNAPSRAPNEWGDPVINEITTTAPKSFKQRALAPVGVPNVAFNYITKAA